MFNLQALHNSIWLAEPIRLQQAIERVRAYSTCPTPREVVESRRVRLEAAQAQVGKAVKASSGKVGLIPILGPVQQRFDGALEKAGGTALEEVHIALDQMLASADIGTIVLLIDSPGGSVYGTQELAEKIYQGRERKKIIAIADSMAASAAFWIGSAATAFYCTPGGEVGSVGVYCMHVDESKALEQEGLKVTLIKAGKYKAEWSSFGPLSEEGITHQQEQVDATYNRFLQTLKRNRGVSLEHVRNRFGQGRLLNADGALEAGMIDRIMTLDELMGKLLGTGGSSSKAKASTEVLRLRHQRAKSL